MVLLKALQSLNFELNEDMPNTEEHKLICFDKREVLRFL